MQTHPAKSPPQTAALKPQRARLDACVSRHWGVVFSAKSISFIFLPVYMEKQDAFPDSTGIVENHLSKEET